MAKPCDSNTDFLLDHLVPAQVFLKHGFVSDCIRELEEVIEVYEVIRLDQDTAPLDQAEEVQEKEGIERHLASEFLDCAYLLIDEARIDEAVRFIHRAYSLLSEDDDT